MLADYNVDDANLEGEILLRHILGIDRSTLYSSLDLQISSDEAKELDRLLDRRIFGEPSAYITGHREFFGLDFLVDRRVLIPRPETELLVEKAIALAKKQPIHTIADIGTGCGAIAVSLAKYLPEVIIFSVDVSPAALEVARSNATSHGVRKRIHFLAGDLVEPLPHPVDMIIANLPYVKKSDLKAETSLHFEPEISLDGGQDGLDIIYEMCQKAPARLRPGGYLLLEIGQHQSAGITALLNKTIPGGIIEISKDLAGFERIITLRLTQP
jgi:release factor glutamine methyltransferase